LLDQLEHVPDFHNSDNLQVIRDVILYRINRNNLANLNQDYTLDYGIKLPSNSSLISVGSGMHDLDIEWIISATSSSSANISNQSSARSQRSFLIDSNNNNPNMNSFNSNYMSSNSTNLYRTFNDTNSHTISSGSIRRPSDYKRTPWDDLNLNSDNYISNYNNNTLLSHNSSHSAPKTLTRSRDVAPLRAFPLLSSNDGYDFLNNGYTSSINSAGSNRNSVYPSTTSYQEKYLKKTLTETGKLNKMFNYDSYLG
jgi:hypothetical protein